ncbi:ABC transporter permease subunit [Kitasatospora sp. NPDC101801]|uniref:ABC transporter permease subunit n=1 Tax=Kitasatospora sp. NPDC101801 TaxID=3364103 RepID=UPI00380EB0B4
MTPTAHRARFTDLIAAEWIKFWSLRSTRWSLLAGALAVLGINVGTAYDHYKYWDQYDPATTASFLQNDIGLADAFTGNASMALVLVLGAIGAVAVTGEYGSGSIRTTFAAVPARRSVLAAKALVVTAVTAVFGTVLALVSFLLTQAVLDGRGAGLALDHPGALRVVLASGLLAPVAALVGMALGAVARHSAASVVAATGLLLMVPLFLTEDRYLTAVLRHAQPFTAWQRLVDNGRFGQVAHPWTVEGAWLVYLVWALSAAALAVAAVHRRDQ